MASPRLLVDAGHQIVAKAADADELEAAVHEARPDVAIIDIRMPPQNADDGAQVARRRRSAYPDLGILVLSQHVETRHSVALVATGGFGDLLKIACSTSTTSSTRCPVSPTATRPWTRRSSGACSDRTRMAARSPSPLLANARCSR